MDNARSKSQQISLDKIDQAYADLKAELIEQARIRKQQALEQSLAENANNKLNMQPHYKRMKHISFNNKLMS